MRSRQRVKPREKREMMGAAEGGFGFWSLVLGLCSLFFLFRALILELDLGAFGLGASCVLPPGS